MAVEPARFKMPPVYRRKAPIAAILDDLASIRTLDHTSETGSRITGGVGCLSVVAAVASGFLFIPMAPVFAIGALVALVLYVRMKRFDVENRRYELLARVLDLLGHDTPRDAEISVVLDLRPSSHKEKFTKKGKIGPWNVKFYTDPWLTLQGRLLDGSAYRLTLIDKQQARTRWARSRSGKMKQKSKTKSATVANLTVKVKRRRYPGLDALAGSARSAVQLPPWADFKKLTIPNAAGSGPDGARVTLQAATKRAWEAPPPGEEETPYSGVRLVAMMYLSLYEVLNLARPAQKR